MSSLHDLLLHIDPLYSFEGFEDKVTFVARDNRDIQYQGFCVNGKPETADSG